MEKYITCSAPCGTVRGIEDEAGIAAFLGIPYGKAERFCPPEPVAWEGTLDCFAYGSKPLQPNFKGVRPAGTEFQLEGGPDCLNLNVWSAGVSAEDKLPVVVYVFGGAYQKGSNSQTVRAGDRFMGQEQMVFVSVNYRVGVFGFLQLSDDAHQTSGNNGALDLLLALRWVRENISAFGGDPDQVTVLGISAGAKMTASLLTHPDFGKYCSRIFLESGAMQSFRTVETARKVTEKFMRILGREDEQELFALSDEILARAQSQLCDAPGTTCFFGPVLDEKVFHSDWMERWERGEGWRGNAVLGSNKTELYNTVNAENFMEIKDQLLKNLFGDNAPAGEQAFGACRFEARTDREAWLRALSDFMYRFYTDRLTEALEKAGCRVWNYSFEFGMACHGMGFGFIMGQQHEARFHIPPEEELIADNISDAMRRAAHHFILTGEPADSSAWRCYHGGNKMIFDRVIRMEYRPEDTLIGFPVRNFSLS